MRKALRASAVCWGSVDGGGEEVDVAGLGEDTEEWLVREDAMASVIGARCAGCKAVSG